MKYLKKMFGLVVVALFCSFSALAFIYDTHIFPEIALEMENKQDSVFEGAKHVGLMQAAPSYEINGQPSFLDWFSHFVSFKGWGMLPMLITLVCLLGWFFSMLGLKQAQPKTEAE